MDYLPHVESVLLLALRQETLKVLELWLRERAGADGDPLFPTI